MPQTDYHVPDWVDVLAGMRYNDLVNRRPPPELHHMTHRAHSQPTHDPTSVIQVDFSKVWCPSCRVGVGDHCLTKSGKHATEAHAARQYLYYTTFPDEAPVWYRQKYPNTEGVALVQADAPVQLRPTKLKPPGMDLVELQPVVVDRHTRIALRCLICNQRLAETVILLADAVRVWSDHVNTLERDL